MAKQPEVIKNENEVNEASKELKIILKSNYPKFDKDGKKVGKYKVDEEITLPFKEAQRLISSAMAIKA